MEVGKFYLFANPWFWTFVGRFVRHINFQEIEIADAIYFTRSGATFDVLCMTGLHSNSKVHKCPAGMIISSNGPKFPWLAKTPWVEKG